jgi:hypothetical protein
MFICYNWIGMVADMHMDKDAAYYKKHGVSKLYDEKNSIFHSPNKDDIISQSLIKRQEALRSLAVWGSQSQSTDIITVKADYIYWGHFQYARKYISQPYTLLSGMSGLVLGGPGYKFEGADSCEEISSIVEDSNLMHWYCTNAPLDVSDKIIPIPIGFQEKEREGGNSETLAKLRQSRTRYYQKKDRVLIPYHNLKTHHEREELVKKLKALPFVDFVEEKLPFKKYIKKMDEYKYVICLEGMGHDLHRNYEALLVDTIPINIKNRVAPMFKQHTIPSEFVDSWDDIDEEWFNLLSSHYYGYDKIGPFLTVEYWADLIKSNLYEWETKNKK